MRPEYEQGYLAAREVLLMLYVFVGGDQNIKLLADSKIQERAVLLTGPAHLTHRTALVLTKAPSQSGRQTFIEK
jgi:hypothetical protein